MRRPISSFRLTQTLLLTTSALLATIVACEMQAPTQPAKQQPVKMDANAAYFEFQVEQPVAPAPGSAQPRYPDLLRKAGVEGEVLAQFVVEPDGTADVRSFKVLKQSHDLFAQAVRNALPQMRFKPALVGGKPVRQLVQQPFSFSMTK
jgi:protein TonB